MVLYHLKSVNYVETNSRKSNSLAQKWQIKICCLHEKNFPKNFVVLIFCVSLHRYYSSGH